MQVKADDCQLVQHIEARANKMAWHPSNFYMAVKYPCEASAQGNLKAQICWEILFNQGYGSSRNFEAAYRWFSTLWWLIKPLTKKRKITGKLAKKMPNSVMAFAHEC